MSQKVYTFTVSEHDAENKRLVEGIKKQCRLTGRTFTWVCLQALKEYVANGGLDGKRREKA